MKTIEQRRASDALERVTELESHPSGFKRSYRSYADSLGPAILMNGLGQALASERSASGSEAHRALYSNIQRWLCREDGVYPSQPDILKAIVDNEESLYLRAQAEALAWLEWHKKFCRAYLPAEDENAQ